MNNTDANCRDADIDLFFTGRGQMPTEALRMCGDCPIRRDCLTDDITHALAGDEFDGFFGVRGGQTPNGRKTIRKRILRDGLTVAAAVTEALAA